MEKDDRFKKPRSEATENENYFWFFFNSSLHASIIKGTTLVAFLITVLIPPIAQQIEGSPPYFWYTTLFCTVLLGIAVVAAIDLRRIGKQLKDVQYADVAEMRGAISQLEEQTRHYQKLDTIRERMGKEKFDRFEDIANEDFEDVKVGYVPFFPTAEWARGSDQFTGIGPELIKAIFGHRVDEKSEKYNWDNMLDKLVDGEIDVIGTPLYEVNERRDYAVFTTPLFYADIGLYCSNPKVLDEKDRIGLIDIPSVIFRDGATEPKTFRELIASLSSGPNRWEILRAGRYKIRAQKDELNHKLIVKHFFHDVIDVEIVEGAKSLEVRAAISSLLKPKSPFHSAFVFCERAQAEDTVEFHSGKIVSLLREGELLVPVSFAVRKNEDTIRKFMNMRLLHIDGERPGGVAKLIADSATKIHGLDETSAKRYFRRCDFPWSEIGKSAQ